MSPEKNKPNQKQNENNPNQKPDTEMPERQPQRNPGNVDIESDDAQLDPDRRNKRDGEEIEPKDKDLDVGRRH